MDGDADLLEASVPPVVPQQPLLAIKQSERFIAGIVIPLPRTWTDNGIGGGSLPPRSAVRGTRQADLGMIHIPETDVKHQIPIATFLHLNSCHLFLLPCLAGLRPAPPRRLIL